MMLQIPNKLHTVMTNKYVASDQEETYRIITLPVLSVKLSGLHLPDSRLSIHDFYCIAIFVTIHLNLRPMKAFVYLCDTAIYFTTLCNKIAPFRKDLCTWLLGITQAVNNQ